MTAPALRALERFLLPNACIVCERAVEAQRPDALVCGVCRSRLRPLAGGCPRCHQPLPPVGPCRFCAAWPGVLTAAWSAVWLDETARAIVHRLKYGGLAAVGDEIAGITARNVPRPVGTMLVPIPLGRRRARARGYNQAAALAHGLARVWRLPVGEGLMGRVRETQSQTALTPEERAENVDGAFEAVARRSRTGAGTDADRGAIILVDDVLTTGATLCAAARALEHAGWTTVGAVTFARALPYDIRAAG